MAKFKYYLGFIFFIFILNNLYSQNDLNIKKGRINTINGEKIKVKNLVFENNQFRYYKNNSSVVNYMKLDNVLKIEKKSGTEAIIFGLGLGAGGLIGSIIGTSSSYYDGKTRSVFIISYTSLCTIVGLIWGSTQSRYKTVYVNPQFGFINIKSDYTLNPNRYALNKYKVYRKYK